MTASFLNLLGRVSASEHLLRREMTEAIELLITGAVSDDEIAKFLRAHAAKGDTPEEVAGAAEAMRAHMTPIRSRHKKLLDTCGTGGGGSDLFNVSTTAALVIAAAGIPVAKHGNRSVTSRSGSADVLAELGVNIEASPEQVERCLDELGVCFCFAPLVHPAMKRVGAVRKSLGIRTIFNILGPLANPAGATHQLLGAGRPELRPLLASALELLGVERAPVISGSDGLGEATLAGPTHATEIEANVQRDFEFAPEEFGLERSSLDALRVESPVQSAAIVRHVLAGEHGPARDIVLLNASAGMMAFDAAIKPTTAAKRAAEAIDSGAAGDLLVALSQLSRD